MYAYIVIIGGIGFING